MTTIVSRESVHSDDGRKMCSRCGRRPPRRGQRWCNPCFAEYNRDWRAGKVQVMLTPGEWKMIQAWRAAAADR